MSNSNADRKKQTEDIIRLYDLLVDVLPPEISNAILIPLVDFQDCAIPSLQIPQVKQDILATFPLNHDAYKTVEKYFYRLNFCSVELICDKMQQIEMWNRTECTLPPHFSDYAGLPDSLRLEELPSERPFVRNVEVIVTYKSKLLHAVLPAEEPTFGQEDLAWLRKIHEYYPLVVTGRLRVLVSINPSLAARMIKGRWRRVAILNHEPEEIVAWETRCLVKNILDAIKDLPVREVALVVRQRPTDRWPGYRQNQYMIEVPTAGYTSEEITIQLLTLPLARAQLKPVV